MLYGGKVTQQQPETNKGNYDLAWKIALKKFLPQGLELFFPDIYEDINWQLKPDNTNNFTFLDKELEKILAEGEIEKKLADCLVQVELKDGNKQLILLHFEV